MHATAPPDGRRLPSERNQTIDIARGVGIILVVYGHLQRGFLDLGTPPHAAAMRLSDFVLYTTHMPLFFLLAGINAYAPLRRQGPGPFLTVRLRTILWPYLLWQALFVLGQRLAGAVTGIHHPVPAMAVLLLPVLPIGIFWFLQSLFLAQGAAVLGRRHPARLLGAVLLADLILSLMSPDVVVPVVTQTIVHLPFFAFGFLAAARDLKPPRWLSGIDAVPTAFGALGLALVAAALGAVRPVDARMLPVACLGIATILIVSRTLAGTGPGRGLARTGRASMPIYLLHIFTLPLFMRAIRPLPPSLDMLLLPAGTVFGIAASLAVDRGLARLGLDGVLGLSGAAWKPGAGAPGLSASCAAPGGRTSRCRSGRAAP